jgi:hypothetical protein
MSYLPSWHSCRLCGAPAPLPRSSTRYSRSLRLLNSHLLLKLTNNFRTYILPAIYTWEFSSSFLRSTQELCLLSLLALGKS